MAEKADINDQSADKSMNYSALVANAEYFSTLGNISLWKINKK